MKELKNQSCMVNTMYKCKAPNGTETTCRVKILCYVDECKPRIIILVTELPENEGMSITNNAEQIYGSLYQIFKVADPDLLIIEHYEHANDPDSDTYDIAKITYKKGEADVSWEPLSDIDYNLLVMKTSNDKYSLFKQENGVLNSGTLVEIGYACGKLLHKQSV